MKVKLKFQEIKKYVDAPTYDFPKYVTQILNLANQNSQATRPKNVGQLSELIQKFSGKKLEKWQNWYLKQYPDALNDAADKLIKMIKGLKIAIDEIDKDMIKNWLQDLVIVKTFLGFKFQEAILKKGAELLKTNYTLSNPEEESQGIDGYIGKIPVSIKPETYKVKSSLIEKLPAEIIYYKKVKDGIEVNYSAIIK